MKFKKVIAASLASIALLGSSSTVVNAVKVPIQLITKKDTYTYNSKGRKVGKIYYKGSWFDLLGTKKIKGKQYYRVGKNKYVKASKVRKYDLNVDDSNQSQPNTPKWQSKHLVDNEVGLVAQIKKAFTLQGEDRLEADKEIAVQLNMSPDSVTVSNQAEFEKKLQSYVGSNDSAKSWIEQGGK